MKTGVEESPTLAEIMGTDEVVQRVSWRGEGELRIEP